MSSGNNLLRDSSIKQRKLLESVRSYLGDPSPNTEKKKTNNQTTFFTSSLIRNSSKIEERIKVEDSPERESKKSKKLNFGNGFKDLICHQNQKNETETETVDILKIKQRKTKQIFLSNSQGGEVEGGVGVRVSSRTNLKNMKSMTQIDSQSTLKQSVQYQTSSVISSSSQSSSITPRHHEYQNQNDRVFGFSKSDRERNQSNPATVTATSPFVNSNWRERIQSFVINKQNKQNEEETNRLERPEGIQTNTNIEKQELSDDGLNNPLQNHDNHTIPSKTTTNSEASQRISNLTPMKVTSSNLIPPKAEVSLNFVRKDMKRRGSYLVRGKKKKISRRYLDNNNINNNTEKGNESNSNKRSKSQPIGLASFGLDPIQLYLESNSPSLSSTSTTKTSELSSSEAFKTIDNRNLSHNTTSTIPLCSGHQMEAKLCTVRKSGSNKVIRH